MATGTIRRDLASLTRSAVGARVWCIPPQPPAARGAAVTPSLSDVREWMTRARVAQIADVSLRTVDTWIADGELDVIKIGRSVRITPEALADLQWRRTRRAADNQGSSRRRNRRRAEGAA